MEDFRSNSYKTVRSMQADNSNPSGMQDLRCYSASYASSSAQSKGQLDMVVAGEQWKFKKGKSTNSNGWRLNDPEVQRKKRVAGYKAFTVEGKVKGSFKNSFRWLKERYTLMIYGYR